MRRVRVIGLAVLLSVAVHIISGLELGRYAATHAPTRRPLPERQGVKVRIVDKKPAKKPADSKQPDPDHLPKILETPLTPTKPPPKADYAGAQDHATTKPMKIADHIPRDRAKDPGAKGKPKASPKAAPPTPKQDVKAGDGRVAISSKPVKPRTAYEALLPMSDNDLLGQVDAGYQDYLDDKAQVGDRIDMNTSEYRFLGYFTNMRKAIELVWNYPMDAARRGMQGEVGLEFAISRDGHATQIKVIKSSGFPILDRAIIEAIQAASPFAPLPQSYQRSRLLVTGSFRYILNSYGSH